PPALNRFRRLVAGRNHLLLLCPSGRQAKLGSASPIADNRLEKGRFPDPVGRRSSANSEKMWARRKRYRSGPAAAVFLGKNKCFLVYLRLARCPASQNCRESVYKRS